MPDIYKTVHTVEIELALNTTVRVYADVMEGGGRRVRPDRYRIHWSGPGLDFIVTVSTEQIIDLFSKLTVAEAKARGAAVV